jgi:protein SCO1/2
VALSAALATVGCVSDEPATTAAERRLEVRGKVVSTDERQREVTIAHEEIPGYMEAMTMPFTVLNWEDLVGVLPGDRVRATLVVTEGRSWLEELTVIGAEEMGTILHMTDPSPGMPVPPLALVNQDGAPLRFDGYRGKALAVTFIFTRCPLPDYCILMSENFKAVQRTLRASPALFERTHLVSVSIDPEYDTPAVLRAYGDRLMGAEPRFDHWEFATGTPEQVRQVAEFFGLSYETEDGQIVHSLRTVVVGPGGEVFEVLRGNDWKPEDVVASLRKALEAGSR